MVDDHAVAHSVELCALDGHLAVALCAEDASEKRVCASATGDDAHLEGRCREASRYAVLVGADLLAGWSSRESVDAKIPKAVGELAAMVRRREHNDSMNCLLRKDAGSDGSAEDDAAHGMGDDIDCVVARDVEHAVPDVLGELFDGCAARRVAEVVDLIPAACCLTSDGPERPACAAEPVEENDGWASCHPERSEGSQSSR